MRRYGHLFEQAKWLKSMGLFETLCVRWFEEWYEEE